MLRTTTHPVTSAHGSSFLPDVGMRDVCIVVDFRRYQPDVFEPTMHARASVALDGGDTLVVPGGAQIVRFAEARGTNPGPVPLRRGPGPRAGGRVDRVLSVFTGIHALLVVVKDMLPYSLKIHQA